MADKRLTFNIKVDADETIRNLRAQGYLDRVARQQCPDYIIEALQEWLRMTKGVSGDYPEDWSKVDYWVNGDEMIDPKEPRYEIGTAVHAAAETIKVDKPESYIFTFGSDHRDKDGNSLARCYVEIPGTYMEARDRMIELFGRNWSMQYDSVEKASRNGRYELTNKSADLVPWEIWT